MLLKHIRSCHYSKKENKTLEKSSGNTIKLLAICLFTIWLQWLPPVLYLKKCMSAL